MLLQYFQLFKKKLNKEKLFNYFIWEAGGGRNNIYNDKQTNIQMANKQTNKQPTGNGTECKIVVILKWLHLPQPPSPGKLVHVAYPSDL